MRLAYAMHPGPGEDGGRVIVVTDEERGFRFVTDYDCSPLKRRPGIVERLNARAGVTPRQAIRLVAASMKSGPVRARSGAQPKSGERRG